MSVLKRWTGEAWEAVGGGGGGAVDLSAYEAEGIRLTSTAGNTRVESTTVGGAVEVFSFANNGIVDVKAKGAAYFSGDNQNAVVLCDADGVQIACAKLGFYGNSSVAQQTNVVVPAESEEVVSPTTAEYNALRQSVSDLVTVLSLLGLTGGIA